MVCDPTESALATGPARAGDTAAPLVWSIRRGGATIAAARDLIASVDELTDDERRCLGRVELADSRRTAWIRGRNLVRRFVAPANSVVADDHGVPRATGLAVGFAHDGTWDAVIVGPCRPAVIDIVAVGAARAAAALRRVRVTSDLDPAETWAAIECALKLTGGHIASVLGLAVEVTATIEGIEVAGIGRPVIVQVAAVEDATLAWATGGIL